MKRTKRLALLIAMAAGLSLVVLAAQGERSAPPRRTPARGDVESLTLPNYRNWTHVKSMVIFDEKHPLFQSFGGIHHIYVNAIGRRASATGGPFPDGSQLVFVLYEHVNEQGAYVAGKKKVEAIMVKDRRRFPETGGWGFQAFDPQTRKPLIKNADVKSACFDCHASQKDNDYVFSRLVP
ncbi:MAG: cytochrome P460 family protein [Blastocatellia bacterium]|nr:cytochrome P460 family protein [Blastocatellia bacterium]MCS7158344.1 cytochrome P460 family protein [Blastocatellia bacterium]MCX7752850.1 cytochrome P460 family protein [Blastocatellia bacterium]MDW8167906.1 cytochrome P460 family protein [Acidobacteriota bacterium]MDW8255931.1 cytochrome P460 family protein [Acidobacteriota bacterium]